jgi:hypothetical protein
MVMGLCGCLRVVVEEEGEEEGEEEESGGGGGGVLVLVWADACLFVMMLWVGWG